MRRGAILNSGNGAWAFQAYAERLSRILWLQPTTIPSELNYLLWFDSNDLGNVQNSFIPIDAIKTASDKRSIATKFRIENVPVPETALLATVEELNQFVATRVEKEWCLKWPVGCGATGHRLLTKNLAIPDNWPKPFVVQEFVRLEKPEVYRTYCVSGEVFGWNVRKYSESKQQSPWVSHANGAMYNVLGQVPDEAKLVATAALKATNLYTSFGCVDLILNQGRWQALEVGTDGIYNHIDRDFDNRVLEETIDEKLATAFWSRIGTPPWGEGAWHYQANV